MRRKPKILFTFLFIAYTVSYFFFSRITCDEYGPCWTFTRQELLIEDLLYFVYSPLVEVENLIAARFYDQDKYEVIW